MIKIKNAVVVIMNNVLLRNVEYLSCATDSQKVNILFNERKNTNSYILAKEEGREKVVVCSTSLTFACWLDENQELKVFLE